MTAPTSGDDLTTRAQVNRLLERNEDDTDPVVDEVVAAVNVLVPRWLTRPAGGWAADHQLGATLLAARLYRRKDSPGGMADFGTEGAAYVSGNWPDVALLLGLGSYSQGRVG